VALASAAWLVAWGDVFDLASYAAFVAVLVWRRRLLQRTELRLLAVTGHVVLLASVDRVAGYPDGGLASHLMPIVWLALDGTALALAANRRIRPRIAVLVICVVHLALAELPGFALRQVAGAALTETPPASATADLLYYSKVQRGRVWAVGLRKGNAGETQEMAMVFEGAGRRHVLTSEIWFVTGGTMDVQEATLSRPLVWLLKRRAGR
jgi:hypothetical protein